MGEPNSNRRDDGLPDTLPTTPAGDLFCVRSALIRELMAVRTRVNTVQDTLAFAEYRDVSKLAADRGRLQVAARLLNEIACTVSDLAFPPPSSEAA